MNQKKLEREVNMWRVQQLLENEAGISPLTSPPAADRITILISAICYAGLEWILARYRYSVRPAGQISQSVYQTGDLVPALRHWP